MLRKTISAGLAICLVFSLCSCEKTPNKTEPQEHQEDVSFISVMLGDKNIEEWDGKWSLRATGSANLGFVM